MTKKHQLRLKTPDSLDQELIDWLGKILDQAEVKPESTGAERKVWYMLGQKSVIPMLQAKLDARDKDRSKNNV